MSAPNWKQECLDAKARLRETRQTLENLRTCSTAIETGLKEDVRQLKKRMQKMTDVITEMQGNQSLYLVCASLIQCPRPPDADLALAAIYAEQVGGCNSAAGHAR